MNANRLANMVVRMVMRHGMKFLANRNSEKQDPKAQEAAKKMRAGRRIGKF